MRELLTTKDVRSLLQVDRSTIYRMAEAGQLPAVKVGKQWRFPAELISRFLEQRAQGQPERPKHTGPPDHTRLRSMLPLECVQVIQDAFAEMLGVMLVITDLDGSPITPVSAPNAFCRLLDESPVGHGLCQQTWRDLGARLTLEPSFQSGPANLACARAFVRVGSELAGMVVVFGIADEDWNPSEATIAQVAEVLALPIDRVRGALSEITTLTATERQKILISIQRIGDVLTHIVGERAELLDRLGRIAELTVL